MARLVHARSALRALLILLAASQASCALLEMSRTLWSKAVAGGLTRIGKLDPLRVPLIKVDQSEGDTSYRMTLRNLEIAGLNESILESVHVARGGLSSSPSERGAAGYVSYSDLRDVDAVRYRFHTMARRPGAPSRDSHEADDARGAARYREDRHGGSRSQDRDRSYGGYFEQSRHRTPSSPRPTAFAELTGDSRLRGGSRTSSSYLETRYPGYPEERPVYVQPVYAQRGITHFRRTGAPESKVDAIDCEDTTEDVRFAGERKDDRRDHGRRQGADDGGTGYHDERIGEVVEVSASETLETRLKNRDDVRPPVSYNIREQRPRMDVAASSYDRSSKGAKTRGRSDYIDIVYADDRANGSMKHFGNLDVDPRENRRVYDIEGIMKEIRRHAGFISHNFTEGEALTKRNDELRAALEARRLKDMSRYAKGYQEQQGYFEEGMQLIYHYGGIEARNGSASSENASLNDTRRTKRAHPEESAEDDDVMHVILRIRVPLLRVKAQYTLTGKVGKQTLRGDGLLVGNFTDLVGDFTLELKRVNEELMIVRAARAKLSAKDNRIALQGMNEEGPVRTVLNHGLTAAEAVAAMLADDFATKGLGEKTADAVIYRMYHDLPAN